MHVMITGSNRGIGLEFVKHFREDGHRVTALCRKSTPELDALGAHVREGYDVRVEQTLPEQDAIDWLILNAGIWRDESLDNMNFESITEQFEVNTLGPLRVLTSVLPRLRRGSKVGLLTSQMGSIADNSSGGRYGYRLSKAALNAAGVSLSHDLKERGVAVALLHPGFVATDMTNHRGSTTPKDSVRGLVRVMRALSLENSGGFWNFRGETLPW